MRVIAGEFRSRRLKGLPGVAVRPTSDRLREALFNILAPRIRNTIFLDAYAGVGTVGIEALSRGAARAIFVERSPAAVGVIRENLRALGAEDRAEVLQAKALAILGRRSADLVFLDPPYTLVQEYREALDVLGNGPAPLVMVQHDRRVQLEEVYGSLKLHRVLRQGDNCVSFYSPSGHPALFVTGSSCS